MPPLSKVWVDYLPQPKNTFIFRVNDDDIYSLVKEEVEYDPTKIEILDVKIVKVNEKEITSGSTSWIIEEVEDKIQTAIGMNHLSSLEIKELRCKSLIANELLDVLTCYNFPEQGLNKLIFANFKSECEQFENEVLSRLA